MSYYQIINMIFILNKKTPPQFTFERFKAVQVQRNV